MKFRIAPVLHVLCMISAVAAAQGPWIMQKAGTRAGLRGLSVVDAKVAWASGSGGTYLRTTDGGNTWTAAQVPGAEGLDFRGVKAFDATTALLMSSGPKRARHAFTERPTEAGTGPSSLPPAHRESSSTPSHSGTGGMASLWVTRSGGTSS